MPTSTFVAEFVESFPVPMDPGVLYVSTAYAMAGHLCPCGCGNEVATKLSPARYNVRFDGEISLSPSVAATGLACNSHYFITRGQVDWHGKLTPKQADRARVSDQRAVQDHRVVTQLGPIRRLWRSIRLRTRK